MKDGLFSSLCIAMVFGTVLAAATPVMAQDGGSKEEGEVRSDRRVSVDPYIEVSQIVSAQLLPGDDVVTYTQVAAGVDASVTGRNNGASVSIRYEKNIGYDNDVLDTDRLSGVVRGYASVVPRVLTVEAGALASRARVDGNGGLTPNPVNGDDSETQIYSAYAGPSFHTRAGDVEINANYRIGYTKVEAPDAFQVSPGTEPIDVFDDSLTQSAAVHLATRPGESLPVGVGVGAGWTQEDVSNLDQRVRDVYVRGDVTVPVSQNVALVAGIGYEDVEISSRAAVLDANGDPVTGSDGRFQTDRSQPRQLAYDVSGLIWDVGVVWRPSRRTSLEAHVGRRYDSTSYYGSFAWAPSSRSNVGVSVYDTVSGFGNRLTTALANLPTEFSASRNALTGDFNGCVVSLAGDNCVNGALGSVRSAVFRSRGVAASYSVQAGRIQTGVAAGYDRRRFIAAPGTVLADANGVIDETFWTNFFLGGDVGRSASWSANAYASYLRSGFDNTGDVLAVGASAAYNQAITGRLSARAAVALDHIDSDAVDLDFATASALLGLRYDF